MLKVEESIFSREMGVLEQDPVMQGPDATAS
jgi:hypothetical protein